MGGVDSSGRHGGAARIIVEGHRGVASAMVGVMGESEVGVLELRPNCECCDKDLPPEAEDAMICTFECTFCRDCANEKLGGRCPNCGGDLQKRPIRPASRLEKYPASMTRVLKP